MAEIRLLDQSTIDKIAAGEVVERPASVVKELLENAIDAGSASVTVEIKNGGMSLVRITDNGCGIPSDQVKIAFVPHATSKLTSAEQLNDIATLGFRGEALASIAAVSKVEMITKTAASITGTRYCIEGGTEICKEEIGAPDGTTFLVRDLFYNVPARKNFLRTAMTEANAVTSVVEQIALSHPEISFKYMVNGQLRLHTSGSRNLKELVYQVFGREIAGELIELSAQDDCMKVSGYIGKPVISRGNRNFENYFVNGRYVKSKLIAKSIEDGYHTSMMQHRYPFTLLFLEMDRKTVDVNVHPTKMELRFSRQEQIYHLLVKAIGDTLRGEEQIVHVSLKSDRELRKEELKEREEQKASFLRESGTAYPAFPKRNLPTEPDPFERMPIFPKSTHASSRNPSVFPSSPDYESRDDSGHSALSPEEDALFKKQTIPKEEDAKPEPSSLSRPEGTWAVASGDGQIKEDGTADFLLPKINRNSPALKSPEPQPAGEQMELFSPQFLSEESAKSLRIIGQVFETYFLVEYDQCLYIIDQHAAHEKVNFERMMKNYREKKIYSQLLNPPLLVSLNNAEENLIAHHEQIFRDFGFELSNYGGGDWAITAVPHNLYGIATSDLFVELLDHLEEYADQPPEILTDRLATMSCKAAVKGNNKLSLREAEALIRELLTLEDPYHCPHGRPTIISISKREMEKKFKRIV